MEPLSTESTFSLVSKQIKNVRNEFRVLLIVPSRKEPVHDSVPQEKEKVGSVTSGNDCRRTQTHSTGAARKVDDGRNLRARQSQSPTKLSRRAPQECQSGNDRKL